MPPDRVGLGGLPSVWMGFDVGIFGVGVFSVGIFGVGIFGVGIYGISGTGPRGSGFSVGSGPPVDVVVSVGLSVGGGYGTGGSDSPVDVAVYVGVSVGDGLLLSCVSCCCH